jgi:hypothetical protein
MPEGNVRHDGGDKVSKSNGKSGESRHQQNYKNLFGLSALSGTFSIVSKTKRGNKYYKFDKLTIYSGVY